MILSNLVEDLELFIVTNNLGTVFTHGRRFAPGEEFTLTAIPDRGHFLESYTASWRKYRNISS